MESPLLFSLNFASLIYQLINAYDLLLIVRTASLANSVRHHQCTTFAALYQCRSAHFPVCSSLISSTFGRFILRTNRHRYTSLFALKISWIAAIRGQFTRISSYTKASTSSCHPSIKLCSVSSSSLTSASGE